VIKSLSLVVVIVAGFLFNGCATNAPTQNSRISKVYETSYPEGISVFISNAKVRKNIEISDARIIYGSSKRQLQCIVNNNSNDIYNLIIDTKWSDDRGSQISSYPNAKKIKLYPGNAKRVVIDAPNYKAKDVLIKVGCGSNCIQKGE